MLDVVNPPDHVLPILMETHPVARPPAMRPMTPEA